MTLQYRIRPKYRDQLWAHRVSLCETLLSTAVDNWCVSGHALPTSEIVTSILYLFSPRCDANALRPSGLQDALKSTVESAETEYNLAWPRRENTDAEMLIVSLSLIIQESVRHWEEYGIGALAIPEVVRRLVDQILAQRYVVLHHSESTRRDANHWGIRVVEHRQTGGRLTSQCSGRVRVAS